MSGEFLINTYGAQSQGVPDITRLADGSILVVWHSLFSEDIGRTYYLAGQRFSATGEPIGIEMVLEASFSAQATIPKVVALADGGFALGWIETPGEFISGQTDVWTRAYDADGAPRGKASRVHGPDDSRQFGGSSAPTADGGYVLTWTSDDGAEIDQWDDVYMRAFDAQGRPLGRARQVNQLTEFDQNNSQAITLANGNILITWESANTGNPPGSTVDAVRGRIYDATGKPLTGEFMVVDENDGMSNAGTSGPSGTVDVAPLDDGGFVISWHRTAWVDNDLHFQVRAQRHDAGGAAVGREIVLWSAESGVPGNTAVEGLDGGGFVVAWTANGGGLAFAEVFAQVFDAEGRALGRRFIVNAPSPQYSDQETPSIQALDDGGFMIVYESEYLDGDDDAIAGRIFGQGSLGADRETLAWTGTYRALAGNDAITGTGGADTINLGNGNDVGRGSGGADVLIGGLGADRLDGGGGADTFLYASAGHSTAAAPDTILRFESGRDTIDLSAIDAVAGRKGNQAFEWINADAFSGKAGELRFADGKLAADIDGDRTADFVIKVTGDPVVVGDLLV
jgi:Ca2+-binding RTX toxin-like protein